MLLQVSPSRRKAISQSIVAKEPVTERFGPKSTPINTAFFTISGACANLKTFPTIKPRRQVIHKIAGNRNTEPTAPNHVGN